MGSFGSFPAWCVWRIIKGFHFLRTIIRFLAILVIIWVNDRLVSTSTSWRSASLHIPSKAYILSISSRHCDCPEIVTPWNNGMPPLSTMAFKRFQSDKIVLNGEDKPDCMGISRFSSRLLYFNSISLRYTTFSRLVNFDTQLSFTLCPRRASWITHIRDHQGRRRRVFTACQ